MTTPDASTYEHLRALVASWGLIFFGFVFLGVCAYAYWPSRRKEFEQDALIPLREDDVAVARASTAAAAPASAPEKAKVRIDPVSGTPTTGHEWDGIEELNTPLPRWWVWTFWVTVIWGVGYTLVYPAWPTLSGGTQGVFAWNSRNEVANELAGLQTLRGPVLDKIKDAPLDKIESDPELLAAARTVGKVAFATNCAACHGAGGQGAKGYANLNDDDWIWGGKLADIQQTIEHGVRWDADKTTHVSAMPAFGRDGILTPEQISIVADHVRTYAETPDSDAPTPEGEKLYAENCASCHGVEGKGNAELGAPALFDQVWLYGSDKPSVVARIVNGGGAVMPAWKGRLDDTTIKALTVYVHSLGGGQ